SMHLIYPFFFFSSYGHHQDLHSFPTRRSSDLAEPALRERLVHGQRDGAGRRVAVAVEVAEDLVPRDFQGVAGGVDDADIRIINRSEEHTSELQSRGHLVCRLLLEKKKTQINQS